MKKLLLLFFMFYISSSISLAATFVSMVFRASPPTSVFYGDTVRIPVQMNVQVHWWATLGSTISCEQWDLPVGSSIEYTSGDCRQLMGDVNNNAPHPFTCYFNIVIPANSFRTVAGVLKYNICRTRPHLDHFFFSPPFSVTVIPHGVSMSTIPVQEATANHDFVYNMKQAVNYYNENILAGKPIQGIVSPIEQDGLRFDQASFSIVGVPQRIGIYNFKVGALNANSTAAFTDLIINVHANPKDKPVFKQHYPIASALPSQKYKLNLHDLIEPQAGFGVTNQISFQLDARERNAEWLKITNDENGFLTGEVPENEAGTEATVTLIASSNTGGNSDPMTVKIPIAYDPTKTPIIDYFELEDAAGSSFSVDISGHIKDPAQDNSLKIILNKVEPDAPWLKVSTENPTVLEGIVPEEVTGQIFQVTLRASTALGGSSEPKTIPFRINIDKQRTPRFKAANPVLPMLYVGQSYIYDFVASRDVYPDFENTPYEIKFAEGYEHPSWLSIENNKLIAENIPEEIDFKTEIKITIHNIPGGQSEPFSLTLVAMN